MTTNQNNNDNTAGAVTEEPGPSWREVSKEEFYRVIGQQDVSASIVNGKWPYTMEFMTPNRQVRGKRVGYLPEGSALEAKKYYLPNP